MTAAEARERRQQVLQTPVTETEAYIRIKEEIRKCVENTRNGNEMVSMVRKELPKEFFDPIRVQLESEGYNLTPFFNGIVHDDILIINWNEE